MTLDTSHKKSSTATQSFFSDFRQDQGKYFDANLVYSRYRFICFCLSFSFIVYICNLRLKCLAKRGNMFPKTPVARACFPIVSKFCHTGSIQVSSVNFVSKKQNLLLLHGRNISCFRAAWKHGKTRKQLRKHVSRNMFPRFARP